MATQSAIEWTDTTWNPLTGCTKISPGCQHCYAERMSGRLKLMGQPNYRNGFELTTHEHAVEQPLRWRKPRRVFVNSMSDLYHRDDGQVQDDDGEQQAGLERHASAPAGGLALGHRCTDSISFSSGVNSASTITATITASTTSRTGSITRNVVSIERSISVS